MVIGIHENDQGRVFPQKRKADIDKELSEIQAQMETLAFKMQQEARVCWRYEWPSKRKSKWLVQNLLTKKRNRC
jgi:hypothetical protein